MTRTRRPIRPVSAIALRVLEIAAHGPVRPAGLLAPLWPEASCDAPPRQCLGALARRGLVAAVERPSGAFAPGGGRLYAITEAGRAFLQEVGGES